MDKILVLDIETENQGYDVMNDNKRIISIQLNDGTTQSIFYADSIDCSLDVGKNILQSKIDENIFFVGFNIRNFDALFLNKFLDIQIPSEQILDISEMPQMESIRGKLGKKRPRLIEICEHLKIDCAHKNLMDNSSEKFKKLPDVIELAKSGAQKWHDEKGWGYNFSYDFALRMISGGMAIMESYNDFVKNNGSSDTLFYKYAMGDVFSEYELFKFLNNS